MTDRTAVVFGAGKIARGFIAHLLTLSGYRIIFVEKSPDLVDLLRARGRYKIHVMGAPDKDALIENFEVLSSTEEVNVAKAVAGAAIGFVSIGGPNLPQIAPLLAAGVARAVHDRRSTPLNIILCENYFQPARWLRKLVSERLSSEENLWFTSGIGLVESLVLRSAVEPSEEMLRDDPLSVRVQDMWEMPADRAAFRGDIPPIMGLKPQDKFEGNLARKLFTYNGINAIISYNGYLKGYRVLSEAAGDPELVELALQASIESGEALCREYGFDPDEQRRFAQSAIAKYQKREIVDPIERNTRDPIRKLGRYDRLVGPAVLALEHGIRPTALSAGIAAALCYDNPVDQAAQELQCMIRDSSLAKALSGVCGIDEDGELAGLITHAYWELIKRPRGTSERKSDKS